MAAMAVVPDVMMKKVEWHLAHAEAEAEKLRRELKELEREVTDLHSPGTEPRRGSGVSDPTARAAQRLASARERLENSERWGAVVLRTRAHFEGAPEGVVFDLTYAQHMTQQDAAELLGVDRQTVRRHRETIVVFAALIAAERGLIRME